MFLMQDHSENIGVQEYRKLTILHRGTISLFFIKDADKLKITKVKK